MAEAMKDTTRDSEPNAFAANALAFTRTRVFEIYILLMSLGVGASILVYYRWTRKPHQVRGVLRFWSRNFIYGARLILGIRWKIEGSENIPDRPVMFVGNHQAYWESIAMTVFIPHLNVVTKRAAMEIPVFGWGLYHAPMIPVDRDEPGKNIRRMIREGKASIKSGRSLLIFPESGRVPVGERRSFSRGFEILYRASGADVVPFVTNAGLHWPSGFQVKHPGTITLRFLPIISGGKPADAFAAEIEDLVNTEKEKLVESA